MWFEILGPHKWEKNPPGIQQISIQCYLKLPHGNVCLVWYLFHNLPDRYWSAGSPSSGHMSSDNTELLTFASCGFLPVFLDRRFEFSGLSFAFSERLFFLQALAQMPFVTCLCPEKA